MYYRYDFLRNVKMYKKLKEELEKLSQILPDKDSNHVPAIRLKTFKSMDELKLTYLSRF